MGAAVVLSVLEGYLAFLLKIFIVPRLYPALFRARMISDFAGHRANVGEQRWFCRNAEEWSAIAERLKQTPCPHCKVVGALIRHGYLRGYDECNSKQKTVRARRIFCSNRHARHGCGRTFSVWLADKVRDRKSVV